VVSVSVSLSVWCSVLRFVDSCLACCLPVATWWESSNVGMVCGLECRLVYVGWYVGVEEKVSVDDDDRVVLYMLPACA
jgi:hypothetical protein